MRMREAEIDTLARYLGEGLIGRGSNKPKAAVEALVACVVEMMSADFETEARLDEEAEKMAEDEARKHPGLDVNRLQTLIKQRLAEKKNFTL